MTNPLNIVFGGTPEFAVPALEALIEAGHRITAVYTQPDRPAGRGRQLTPSPIKQVALKHALHLEQPETLRTSDAAARLASFHPDVMIVVAYGLLLPQAVLDVPRLGCINIHASLLPRWRGAAPIQRAILAGDTSTGVCIMRMEAGLDTGPVLSRSELPIEERESAGSLHDKLATLGARTIVSTLDGYSASKVQAIPQEAEGITYAHKLRKEEAKIDWEKSAVEIDRQVRAFNPWPIAETRWQGHQLRIWEATPIPKQQHTAPTGCILTADPTGIVVATGQGVLSIQRLQLAGRKVTTAAEFINAYALTGTRLDANDAAL